MKECKPLSKVMTPSENPALLRSRKNTMMGKKAECAQGKAVSGDLLCEVRSPTLRVSEVKSTISQSTAPATATSSKPLDATTSSVPVPQSLISRDVTSTPPLVVPHNLTPVADLEVSPSELESVKCNGQPKSLAAQHKAGNNNKRMDERKPLSKPMTQS